MILFKDLYNTVNELEQIADRMDIDIDNSGCALEKCILSDEQFIMVDAYQELMAMDVIFVRLELKILLQRVEECTNCIVLLDDVIPIDILQPITYIIDNCPTNSNSIPKEYIDRFRIYEMTPKGDGFSDIEVYIPTTDTLPYNFEPSVPIYARSYEEYKCDWSTARNALMITLDHALDSDYAIPNKSFNIVKIVAELTAFAADLYGVTEVTACQAFLITDNITFDSNHSLDKSIDGNESTWCSVIGNPSQIISGFVFKI